MLERVSSLVNAMFYSQALASGVDEDESTLQLYSCCLFEQAVENQQTQKNIEICGVPINLLLLVQVVPVPGTY